MSSIVLIKGDAIMNGIAHAFILGAGVSLLITITKTVLKYLGCDDALLANMKSMSPINSLRAIGRGVKAVGAKAKSKIQSKRAGGRSSETEAEDKGSEREQLQRTTKKIAGNRKEGIQRARMDKSSGGGYAETKDVKPRGKITRYSSREDFKKVPKAKSIPVEKPSSIARERKIAGKSGQGDSAKLKALRGVADKAKLDNKKNKDAESIAKALDKFTKAIIKLTKPTVKVDGNKKPTSIERKWTVVKGIKPNIATAKPASAGNAKDTTHGLPKRTAKPTVNVNTNVSTTSNVRPVIKAASNRAGDYALKESVKRNEQLLRQNMDKLKKINTNVQAVPRKITKNINSKKPK